MDELSDFAQLVLQNKPLQLHQTIPNSYLQETHVFVQPLDDSVEPTFATSASQQRSRRHSEDVQNPHASRSIDGASSSQPSGKGRNAPEPEPCEHVARSWRTRRGKEEKLGSPPSHEHGTGKKQGEPADPKAKRSAQSRKNKQTHISRRKRSISPLQASWQPWYFKHRGSGAHPSTPVCHIHPRPPLGQL